MTLSMEGCISFPSSIGWDKGAELPQDQPFPAQASQCQDWAERQTERALRSELLKADDGNNSSYDTMMLNDDGKRLRQKYLRQCKAGFGLSN